MSKAKDIILFSGSSNPKLGAKITKYLSLKKGKIVLKKFANGETYTQFSDNIRGKDVFLLQTATEPINDNLVELLIMIDAAKRASAGRIVAVIPNFFYARQDRKTASREPITARLVADLLTTAGADRIITIDLHSNQTQGFFNIPLDNLPTSSIMVKKANTLIKKRGVIVAPDAGSVKRATEIALKMGLELAIINKTRLEHNKAKALNIIGAASKPNHLEPADVQEKPSPRSTLPDQQHQRPAGKTTQVVGNILVRHVLSGILQPSGRRAFCRAVCGLSVPTQCAHQ